MTDEIRELIERSSLGTPGARHLRARTSDADAQRAVDRSEELVREDAILAQLDAGLAVVVRLPGYRQPYGPFLRRLRDEGRLVPIGRPGPWGHPIKLTPGAGAAERARVVAAYDDHLDETPELVARLPELRGKALACWCHPLPCHGDVLVARVNALA